MHLFALETDTEAFKKRYLYEGEQEVLTIYNHGFKFALAAIRLGFLTLFIVSLAVGAGVIGAPWFVTVPVALVLWLIGVGPRLLSAFLDWRYDFTFVTTDKVVLVDQSSLFRQRITPINLENFASVSTETQFWNVFPFGALRFHLKAGLGEDLVLRYIPHADRVAAAIANAVTVFQRRKDLRRYSSGQQAEQTAPPPTPDPAA